MCIYCKICGKDKLIICICGFCNNCIKNCEKKNIKSKEKVKQ